ncbi:MAG: hypothetical protein CFE21_17265 [Bacteroidetes bacterium B1(2017)]|nr:MAG: hypothetical protein CFE21_17265 [Bacteroidetes bacterium B1(2017)]
MFFIQALPTVSGQCLFYKYQIDRTNKEPNFAIFNQVENDFFSITWKYVSPIEYGITIHAYDSCGNDKWFYNSPDSLGYHKFFNFYKNNYKYYFFGVNPNLGWSPVLFKFSTTGKLIYHYDIGTLFTTYNDILIYKDQFVLIGNKMSNKKKNYEDACIKIIDTNITTIRSIEYGYENARDEFLFAKFFGDTLYAFFQSGVPINNDSTYLQRPTYIFKYSKDLQRLDSFRTELPLLDYFNPKPNKVTGDILLRGSYQTGNTYITDIILTNWQGKLLKRFINKDGILSIEPFRDGWIGIVNSKVVFYTRDLVPYKTLQVVPDKTLVDVQLTTFWNERVIAVYGKARNFLLDTPEDDYLDAPFMMMFDSSGTQFATRTSLPITAPSMVLFPNPTTGNFRIKFEPDADGTLKEVEIINLQGQVIDHFTTYSQIDYQLEGVQGVYLVRVYNASQGWGKTFRVLKL